MASGVGQLIARLGLDASDFVSGLNKADVQAQRFAERFDRGVATAIRTTSVALLGVVTSAGLAAAAFQKLVVGAGDFQDLAETTGASAEAIASFAVAAGTAGVEMEAVGGAMNRLTKNLVGVDDESKAAGAALNALGLSVKDFKALDPAAQYEAVGKALGGYADGASKIAVAQALFGKSGTEQLKVFKALEEAGGRQVILTQAQIERADAYADAQARAKAQLVLYAQSAATELLPAITDATKAVTDFVRELISVDEATKTLTGNSRLKDFAQDVQQLFGGKKSASTLVTEIQDLETNLKRLQSLGSGYTILGFLGSEADRDKEIAKLADQLKQAKRLLSDQTVGPALLALGQDPKELARRGRGPAAVPPKPELKFNGAAKTDNTANLLKKQLDGQIEAIREYAERQRDYLEFANRYAQSAYDDGLTSLSTYFATQRDIREAALQATVDGLNKEQAALEAALPKTKAAERVDIENKIAKVVAKRGEAAQKAAQDGSLAAADEARRIKDLADRYNDLRAATLQLSGDSAGAAELRSAKQIEEARKLISQAGGNQTDGDAYARALTQSDALAEAQRQYAKLVDSSRTSEELLLLSAQAAGNGQLETLAAVGAARRGTLAQLGELADKARELALASGGNPEAIAFAERLGLAYKQAAAEADPLAKKFNDLFSDSFADAFTDFATGAKSASEAFKSFANSVAQQIARMAAQNIAQSIFGGGTAAGGTAGSGGYGAAIGTFLSGIFGGGKAIGGPTMPNTLYRVGERRPEVYDDGSNQYLLTGSKRGRVNPNPQMGGSNVTNYSPTFVVQGAVDRRTQSQVFAKAAQGAALANARNN